MDYLQYTVKELKPEAPSEMAFKPYYKWITFNTECREFEPRFPLHF